MKNGNCPAAWLLLLLAAVVACAGGCAAGCAAPQGIAIRHEVRIVLAGLDDAAGDGAVLPVCGTRIVRASVTARNGEGRQESFSFRGPAGNVTLGDGDWEIRAEAHSSTGSLMAVGTGTVSVGTDDALYLRLAVASGSGSVRVLVNLPPGTGGEPAAAVPDGFSACLVPLTGGLAYTTAGEAAGGVGNDAGNVASLFVTLTSPGVCAISAEGVPAGYHLLRVSVPGNGAVAANAVAAVLVLAGVLSTGVVM